MKISTLMILFLFCLASTGGAVNRASMGVKPADEWNCPRTHPIKGNINLRKGTMIYHLPGGAFYDKTKPEKCYATEEDARADGFRKSKR